MKQQELLAEVDDILRTMPDRSTLRHPTSDNFSWFGRAAAFMQEWNALKAISFNLAVDKFHSQLRPDFEDGFRKILILLNEARHDLILKTVGPSSIAIGQHRVFDYFEELRKIVVMSKRDLFFIDAYLDADFVSRYLPLVTAGVTIRLLARDRLSTLLPAVDLFAQQAKAVVHVRSAPNFHDRYVIVDEVACYQSGTSFKDGARKTPTTLTQITDAFAAVHRTYEEFWKRAKVER